MFSPKNETFNFQKSITRWDLCTLSYSPYAVGKKGIHFGHDQRRTSGFV